MALKIVLIGFGTVGQGLVEILQTKADALKKRYDFSVCLVGVSDMLKGAVACDRGLAPDTLLDLVKQGKPLDAYPKSSGGERGTIHTGWDAVTTIENTDADVVCELSYTDLKTGEPAITHCRKALLSGKSVVTSNKGPAVLGLKELRSLANERGLHFFIEGTVMSGTPAINLMEFCLAGNDIREIKGILNGTTNYILTKMGEGMDYEEAMKKAQELGYAEADPTGDVEGFDAMAKVIILANCLMDGNLTAEQVEREGITGITKEDIARAAAEDKRWKLISHLKREADTIHASVKPVALPLSDPLAGVNGADNALTYVTDLLGNVTVVGAGAGRTETGFSILIDLLRLNRLRKKA